MGASVERMSAFDLFFVLAIVFFCTMSGYLYIGGGHGGNDQMRAVVVLLCLGLSVFFYFGYVILEGGSLFRLNVFSLIVVFLVFYGVILSVAHERISAPVSYSIRLISFALLVEVGYRQALKRKKIWLNMIGAVFLISILIYSLEMVYDQLAGRVMFFNGAYRHAASIGSSIGFSVVMSVIALTMLPLWLFMRQKKYLAGVIFASLCVFATATRSVSVMLTLFVVFGFWFGLGWRGRVVLLSSGIVLINLLLTLQLEDVGVVSRIMETISMREADTIDQSSLFRLMILETYFSRIDQVDFWLGLGLGSFPLWFFDVTNFSDVAPHFEWLWILAEFGVFGAFFYVMALIYATYRIFRVKNQSGSYVFVLGVYCIFAHQLIFQFANPFYFYQAFILFSFTIGWLLAELSSNDVKVHKG